MDIDAIDRKVRELTRFMERAEPVVAAFEAYSKKANLDDDDAEIKSDIDASDDDLSNPALGANPMTPEEVRQAIMQTPVYVPPENQPVLMPAPDLEPETVETDAVEPIDPLEQPDVEGASQTDEAATEATDEPSVPTDVVTEPVAEPVETDPVAEEAEATPVADEPVEAETAPIEIAPIEADPVLTENAPIAETVPVSDIAVAEAADEAAPVEAAPVEADAKPVV